MLFTTALYASLFIFFAGLAFRLRAWLITNIGSEALEQTPGRRLRAALGAAAGSLGSRRLPAMLRAFFLDGLLQRRTLAHSPQAWLAHTLMFFGMLGLIAFHALGWLFLSDPTSTLASWLFMRNLCGLMLLAGVGLVVWRRLRMPGLRRITRGVDKLALGLLALMLLSGFGLEAVKILSSQSFSRMTEQYASIKEPKDRQALAQYWERRFGVAFAPGEVPAGQALLARGAELHEESCQGCHGRPAWAFLSWPLSQALRPTAAWLRASRAEGWLWPLHYLAVFASLALLPFSKFLHLLTGPLLLMIRAAGPLKDMDPAVRALVRALELDVCTHCGACSLHCSVAVTLRHVPNLYILPSEKLTALKRPAPDQAVRQGVDICTSCYRCTRICPVGIDLQDLWLAQKDDLARAGLGPTSAALARQAHKAAGPSRAREVVPVSFGGFQKALGLSMQADNFSECYRCVTCSNGCPVVFAYEDPQKELDLLPHQIMHCLGLGLIDEALGARMTWYCLTCYRCQEACPQGVRITDTLYELRRLAATRTGQGEIS